MSKSILLAANESEGLRSNALFELDDSLIDLVSGGAVVKCASKEYAVTMRTLPDGSSQYFVDCVNA